MVNEPKMTEAQAREIIAVLSSHFNVAVARLQWVSWSKNGRYLTHLRQIQCGPNCWRGAEFALLHEFAHHLLLMRNRRAGTAPVGPSGMKWRDYHGELFINALLDIAEAWYGDPARYAWDTEYRSIRNFAVSHGISQTSKKEKSL